MELTIRPDAHHELSAAEASGLFSLSFLLAGVLSANFFLWPVFSQLIFFLGCHTHN
jgi:hypothetical protein